MDTNSSAEIIIFATVLQEVRVPLLVLLVGYILFSLVKSCIGSSPDEAVVKKEKVVQKKGSRASDVPVSTGKGALSRGGSGRLAGSQKRKRRANLSVRRRQGVQAQGGDSQADVDVGDGIGSSADDSFEKLPAADVQDFADVPGFRDEVDVEDIEKLFGKQQIENVVPMARFRRAMNRLLPFMDPPMQIREIATDGHCLYRSISHLLHEQMGIERSYLELRQDAHHYLMDVNNNMKDFYANVGGVPFNNYCDGIIHADPPQFGDHLELTALYRIYHFQPYVYELVEARGKDAIRLTVLSQDELGPIASGPIFRLAFDPVGKHFDLVERLGAFRSLAIVRYISIMPTFVTVGLVTLLVAGLFRQRLYSMMFSAAPAPPADSNASTIEKPSDN